MRSNILYKRMLFFTVIMVLMFFSVSGSAQIVNKIIAVVNDDVITEDDVNKFFTPVKLQLESKYEGKELDEQIKKTQKNLLEKIIQDKLLLSEAKKRGITIDDDDVEFKLKKVKESFQDEESFIQAMENSGLTISDLKERYKQQFIIDKLITRQIKARVQVTPKEMMDYYNDNQKMFLKPPRVKIRQIFIPFEEEQAIEKISDAKEILDKGGSFEKTLEKYSKGLNAQKGGELGIREKGELVYEIDKEIFSLKPGEISDIIETEIGYHIFKVDEIYPSSVRGFEEVSMQIKDILFREKAQKKFENFISELKKDSYISIQNEQK